MFRDHRLDPELAAPINAWRDAMKGGIDLRDIPAARQLMEKLLAAVPKPPPVEGVRLEDRHVPGPAGAGEVTVRLYRPESGREALPALLWIHGGGYVLGNVERDDAMCANLARYAGCLIVIGGASAGGGLAAGLALLARDRAEVALKGQLLIYPMIDDRNIAPPGAGLADTHVWTRENNRAGWRAYLGRDPGGHDVSAYAAASRAKDLARLPPAFISVGDIDLFLDENIDYAKRLLDAGVPTELHVYPGGCHGFNSMAPNSELAKRSNADRDEALKRMLRS
jgi:acetyl esterase/lipase